jgi:Protein of unknown function (DUF2637)
MTGTDRYRTLTALAVLLVAAIAAVISYQHVVALAIRYGQPPLAAYLLPVSIDGLVAVSSLVMLRSARTGVSAPWLARTGLVLAVIATLACNVGYGVAHGWPGALLSGWPAVAFVVAAETAITMTRQRPAAPATDTAVPEPPAGLNGHADRAAEIFSEDLAAGQVPGIRKIRGALNVGQPRATEVREYLQTLAASNGHGGQ